MVSATARSALRRTASSRRQSAKAFPAASKAASTCSGVASGAAANTAPVAGLTTSKVRDAGAALPSMVKVNASGLSDMGISFGTGSGGLRRA